MSIDHLMASSAIPVIFPAVKLDGQYFGDGSMRQISPISSALHLGAEKILVIGLRRENDLRTEDEPLHHPSLAQIAGYILDTLFLNSLHSDIERMERVNRTLKDRGQTNGDKLKIIDHLVISPSKDIAGIATKYYKDLPKSFRIALAFLGLNRGNSRRFISYLMFLDTFCQELIELGYQDAMERRTELLDYFES